MEKYLEILTTFNNQLVHEISIIIPIYIKYYLVFKVEILILFSIIDLILLGLWELNFKWYYKIKYRLVKKPNILIRAYKINQSFSFFINSIRPWYISYKTRDENELINTVYGDSIAKKIKIATIAFFNPRYISNILAIIATIFLYYEVQISSIVPRYLQLVNKDNLYYFLSILPTIIIIITIFIGWKFTSLRGRYFRGANRLNQKIIEETLDIHRRLVKPLLIVIIKGSKNVEYALRCKDLLLASRIKKISPYIKDIENNRVIWNEEHLYRNTYEKESYLFDTIEEINEVIKIIDEARDKHIFNELFWIKHYSNDMFGLRELKWEAEKLEEMLRLHLFTPKTLTSLLKEDKDEVIYQDIQNGAPDEENKDYIERQILKDIDDFNERFKERIISTLEMLVNLSSYNKAVYRLLHFNSNRFGRTLSFWTDRE